MLRIAEYRKAKKITAKQLSEHINVAESTMCLYENGKRTPDYQTIVSISEFLGVPTSYLYGEQVHGTHNRIRSIRNYFSQTKAYIANFLNVSEETVSKWEEGILPVPEICLTQISNKFNFPLEFVSGFSFHLNRPTNIWASDDEADYKQALKANCEDVLLFKLGQGYFDATDQKEKPVEDDGLSPNRRKLIDFARSVPEEKVEQVYSVIQSILEALK